MRTLLLAAWMSTLAVSQAYLTEPNTSNPVDCAAPRIDYDIHMPISGQSFPPGHFESTGTAVYYCEGVYEMVAISCSYQGSYTDPTTNTIWLTTWFIAPEASVNGCPLTYASITVNYIQSDGTTTAVAYEFIPMC